MPPAFIAWIRQSHGDAQTGWLNRLPLTIDELCRRWNLLTEGSVWHGGSGIAIPVRQNERALVLKLSPPSPSHEIDVIALLHWTGHGMVELVDEHPASGAMLLERLGDESLADEAWRTAVEVCADLVRQTAIPACDGLPRVTDLAAELADNLEAHWERTGRPISRERIDDALTIVARHRSDSTDLMVNWDMYPGNIIRGSRQPWIVIDPKPARGAPEYGIAPMFWRLIDHIDSRSEFNSAFQTLVVRGNLDPVKLRDWTFVRVVDYWLWACSKGLTEDPRRCSRVLDALDQFGKAD